MKKRQLLQKAVAIITTASLVATMSGCGNSATETSSGSQTASTSDTSSGDEVTIKVMVWDRGDAAPNTTTEDNTLTEWIQEQMKELYNINVEYVSVPRSESDDKLNIMMSGGTAPDIVFTYDQTLFYNYASSGALKDLSDAYTTYGSNIAEYCSEAQTVGDIGDSKYAVMKQRGTESARHIAYIRQDWLDELGMDLPTTKEELGEFLYAAKENNLGGSDTIPWAMSGRTDTEKMYLNFVGSYVDLASDRDAYIYSENYMAIAPGSEDGLRQLNTWYNDGLITQDFPTDTSEDVYLADIANGNVGFVLDDASNPYASFEVLNDAVGSETFVPVECFDLSDGSYRLPFEYRYAMFDMIPATTDDSKVAACMEYLNWMADPEVAEQIYYTPDYTVNDAGVAVAPTDDEKNEEGYPGTPDDLCIMNINFDWVNDVDTLAETAYSTQTTDWASVDWYKNVYTMQVTSPYKYRFPVYSYVSDDEQTYGTDLETKMLEFVYQMICCPSDEFDADYESGYAELVNAGLQKVLDARAEYYDSIN